MGIRVLKRVGLYSEVSSGFLFEIYPVFRLPPLCRQQP